LQICDTLLLNISTEELAFDYETSFSTLWKEYGHRVALIALMSHPLYHMVRAVGFFLDTIVLLLLWLVRCTISWL
jgi:glycogen synthase